jgi:hypothetical protein
MRRWCFNLSDCELLSQEVPPMACSTRTRSRLLPIPALLVPVLLPAVAWAGWGDENWGEMVWGAGAPQIPAMTVGGIVAVAALLLGLSYWPLAVRRRRAKRPPLDS